MDRDVKHCGESDVNPYRSPQAVSVAPDRLPHRTGAERFRCPHCDSHAFRFSRLYWWPPWIAFDCPQCQARLKVAKRGLFRCSELLVTAPFFTLVFLWALGAYTNILAMAAALIGGLFLDYLVDSLAACICLEHPPYAERRDC